VTVPVLVLWDIDGTLLTTQRAGIKAWEDAVRTVVGEDLNLEELPTSGLTDPMIARQILIATGSTPDPETERRLGEAYTDALPDRLGQRRGFTLPGVLEVLDFLVAHEDVLIGLLTGNYRRAADAKLGRYGLSQYFGFGGFGDGSFDRVDIGRSALDRARVIAGDLDPERMFLVGDSPYDVACAARLGMRMIAVATGTHSRHELEQGPTWWLLDTLPPVAVFAARLGLGTPCSAARAAMHPRHQNHA